MFDILSFIIVIFIIIGKFIGKNNNGKTHNPKGASLWNEFERNLKKINKPYNYVSQEQKRVVSPVTEHVMENEVKAEKPKEDELVNQNTSRINIADTRTETYYADSNTIETKKSTNNEDVIEEQHEDIYDLSINREDIIKSIIFSELLNEPLCKRNAK
jgi:hypothetical protein